ncbi:MAG: hypothetical protein ABIO44_01930 [Saprospiraceae bacterium]
MRNILVSTLLILLSLVLGAQSNGYGLRLGSGISTQKWQGGDQRSPLLTYHVDFFMDSESEGGNIFYGALGYHQRGSSVRFFRFVDQLGNVYPGGSFALRFHQVGLEIGIKKAKSIKYWKLAYGIGLRGEYTIKSDLELFQEYKDYVKKFNYGFTICGSAETKLNKFIALGFEIRASPDVSRQIYVPAAIPWYDPYTNSSRPGYEQSIRNLGFEASLYLRFIQLIQYIE